MTNYRKQYGGDDARIRRRLERERFILPKGSSFYDLYEQRNEANIGELINIALEKIEDTNRAKLEGVFRNIDFNSESNLGRVKDRNRRLKNMLEDFAKPALGLLVGRPGREREGLGVDRLVEAGHDLAPVLVEVEGSLTGIELGQVGLP